MEEEKGESNDCFVVRAEEEKSGCQSGSSVGLGERLQAKGIRKSILETDVD